MRTIELQIQDDIYDELKNKGIDISHKLQEFLSALADDGYPAISTNVAKRRVTEAVKRYKDRSCTYTLHDKIFVNEMENYIQSL